LFIKVSGLTHQMG